MIDNISTLSISFRMYVLIVIVYFLTPLVDCVLLSLPLLPFAPCHSKGDMEM